MSNFNDPLIFGKDKTEKIVSIETSDGSLELFIKQPDGSTKSEFVTNKYWLLSDIKIDNNWIRLKGDLHYKWGRQFSEKRSFNSAKGKLKHRNDIYTISDPRENAMVNKGITMFKGLKPQDLSVLSFDIETTGINHNADSRLLIIANTFRNKGQVYRKLFCYDEYTDEGAMLSHWVNWVKKLDPDILCGHNVLSFDLPYIKFIADKFHVPLNLGRNDSRLEFFPWKSNFRVDGNRTQEYTNVRIYGREVIDTYFGLIRWDIKKDLESYALKSAISQLGLEVENRQHYDASQIGKNYKIPEEWAKIKTYAQFDGDDALAIYDKIIPTVFYMTQSVPKTFQQMVLSASGSQINAMLVRSYLQNGHSIPKASEAERVEGGISFGVPGIYKNVFKIDLKSAYPSQIIRFKLYDKDKDPEMNYYKMTKFFTDKRLSLKELLLKSMDIYLVAQDDTAKVFINSVYGVANTPGLNFNSPKLAAKITFETRQLIENAILWASSKHISEWWVKDEPEEVEEEAS